MRWHWTHARRARKAKRRAAEYEWARWFAWHAVPVVILDRKWTVWLVTVERRRSDYSSHWMYRLP